MDLAGDGLMRILVVNAGSVSLKLALLDGEHLLANQHVEIASVEEGERSLSEALADLDNPDAVGHRVVHGGGVFTDAVRIDVEVRDRLGDFVALAPLHQPSALAGIDLVSQVLPGVPAVACFDTAFHATMPPAASTYAIPAEWRDKHGLRRYGFHGLSHAYASRRAAAMVGSPIEELRIVVCHLGAGASLCAIRAGESIDTTMGFTPLEGLVMASRPGNVDPGLLVWLLRNTGIGIDDLDEALEHRSGLMGLAGTPDMRVVIERAQAGEDAALVALEVYLHRLRAGIASMAASLGGLDVLVFTGGVGENAPVIRAGAATGLGFLGVEVDAERNADADGDSEIGAPTASVRCLVIGAREDLEIVREVRRVLQPSGSQEPTRS
ncbi:acetate/propionate family kinase [Actinopolymorpha alba]|uniref:acetate/propionate family kinase n=1 Tax=Actinopolymorpha alba TaxID=533267 RepID=UPI0003697CBA|nr:acetate/propionate family kinase [Actinopolymorpha alba]